MTNKEAKQIVDRLCELSEKDMKEMFGSSSVEDILGCFYLYEIKNRLDEREKPKYGDVFVNEFGNKCIFLAFDKDNGVWYLCEKYEVPQCVSSLESFNRIYKNTGKNVADKIKGYFK